MSKDNLTQSENFKTWQRYLTGKAQNDAAFRQELINDPKATIMREIGAAEGSDLGELDKLNIVVHENSDNVMHFIIPTESNDEDELSDGELEMVSGGMYDDPKNSLN